MATSADTFQRLEKKFLLTADQYLLLRKEFEPYMQVDQYGMHTICNIYFDTDDDVLIRRSIEKPVYKEKLRLRSYGIPGKGSIEYLEIKKKYKKVVYKRRIPLSYEQAEEYLKSGVLPQAKPGPKDQILRELRYFNDFYQPKPKVFLAYDRVAMAGIKDPELRVTFDCNIRCREDRLDPALGDDGELILPADKVLMEIKVPGAYPIWMTRILSREKLYPTSFSKYGTFHKQKLLAKYLDDEEEHSNLISLPGYVSAVRDEA